MPSLRSVGRGARTLLAQPRLLLAVKTALAAAFAWWLAPQVPGVAAEYPYYAPLGAVIAMYPTVKRSLRLGVQSVIGVVLGILLATVVTLLQTGYPGVLTVALVVGVGVLVGGARRLGAGRDWVLTAGLFVLLLSGSNGGEAYAIGYIVQIGIGVVIGVLVNLLVVPPLYTGQTDERLRRTRAALADRFDDVASVFAARWPLESDEWEERLSEVPETMRAVREQVQQAEEASSLNPRRLVQRRDLGEERRDLVALERVSFHLQDAAEVSGILARRIGLQIGLPDDLAGTVSRAVAAVAVVVREGRTAEDGGREVFTEARRAVADLWDALDASGADSATDLSGGVSIAVSLGRTIAALDPDDTTAPRPEDDAAEPDEGEVGGTDSTGDKDDEDAPRDTAPHDAVDPDDAEGADDTKGAEGTEGARGAAASGDGRRDS